MPNTFLDARDRWVSLSEIDYLGHFVRAWLAFNAWYRSAYTDTQDRTIIDTIKWQPNPARSKLLPLVTADNSEGAEFRANIGLLHERLESYRLETGKGDEKAPITLRNVYLKTRVPRPQIVEHSGVHYEVRPGAANGSVVCEVRRRSGVVCLSISQTRYNLTEIETHADFAAQLNQAQQGRLRGLYVSYAPRLVADVTRPCRQSSEP